MSEVPSRHAPAPEIFEVARQVADVVEHATRSSSYRVFLFGSHVSGLPRPTSDIDIGIEGPAPLDPRVMQEIRDGCERLPTLRTIDLVDLGRVSPEFRRAVILWPIDP